MMLLTKNFKIVNKILYVFCLFEQRRQSNNITITFVINNKIKKIFDIIIKKFKCYNYDKTNHKVFVYFNEHVFNQNFSN